LTGPLLETGYDAPHPLHVFADFGFDGAQRRPGAGLELPQDRSKSHLFARFPIRAKRHELEIRTTGWYNRALDNPLARNVDNQAVAVFSNGPSLDPDWSRRHRVHGAIQYGSPFYTLPTWVGNKPTDIEEDFGIGAQGLRIRAPQFATTLLFTPFDNGFWNNGDDFSMPGADPRGFGVEWRWVQTVPEPGTVAALSLGAVLLRRRKRAS
jgi:hypothetical protein